ncbi:MAG: ABC transporter permease [Saprospiraceae bacterium]|nr:ABC transporter permease [Saprospiraceae bacterium]
MLRNYLKLGFRNLVKQRASSAINILGLAVGLASAIFILLWIQHETTYDQFHERSDQLYRLTSHMGKFDAALTPAPIATALRDEFSEVELATRTSLHKSHLVTFEETAYEEKNILYVDSNFLEVFSFPLLKGDPASVLDQPESILLTETAAIKYFGAEEPVGQILQLDAETRLSVTGVLADPADQSHLTFDMLIPMAILARSNRDLQNNSWDNFDWYSYVGLTPGLDQDESAMLHLEQEIDGYYRTREEDIDISFRLQPITDIHLRSQLMGDVAGLGNAQYVFILSIAVILLLLIATINFMNLATAKATDRAKEVSFRKVAGARRQQLIGQFLIESSIIAFFSFLLAITVVFLLTPSFATLTGVDISGHLTDGRIIAMVFALTVGIGLLAGSYPAFYLSNFSPKAALHLQRKVKGRHTLFRNALVVIQFFFSILFLTGTAIIYQQQTFIRNQNLGFERENLLYIPLNRDLQTNAEALGQRLRNDPATANCAFAQDLPTDLVSGTININWDGKNPEEQILFATLAIDDKFIEVFDMQMRSGGSFDKLMESDLGGYILNEKALGIMEMDPEQAVGKTFNLWGTDGPIVGVVEDFHFKPIRQPIEPLVMRYREDGNYVVIRTAAGATEDAIASLEKICRQVAPSYPFEFGFVDDDLNQLYQSEQRLGALVKIFAMIAIFVSCLGLYGLSAFLANQRRKEVGVRKVLGATVPGIVFKLSKDFTRPVWVAMIIALPIAYIGASKWLENFAYHVDLHWLVLVGSCAAAWLIAMLTTGIETLRVARADPIAAIKAD